MDFLDFDILRDCLTDLITVRQLNSRDDYGKPIYADGVEYKSRVVYKANLIRFPDGREEQSNGLVWLEDIDTLTTEDEITLPDGSKPPIIQVDRYPDHHLKVYFG